VRINHSDFVGFEHLKEEQEFGNNNYFLVYCSGVWVMNGQHLFKLAGINLVSAPLVLVSIFWGFFSMKSCTDPLNLNISQ